MVTLVMASLLCLASGCSRNVVSVDALKREQSFDATVLEIEIIRDLAPDETIILVSVETSDGRKITIGGPTADDKMVKRAELMTVGRRYVFPDALLE
jgi:hypothetical protein